MTLRLLDVPYADTSAGALSLALDREAPTLPRLGSTVIEMVAGPGTRLDLHLLGASHEIVFATPDGEAREVVACLPLPAPHLPASLTRQSSGVRYRFTSRVSRLSPDRFAAEAAALRARLADDVHALVGLFPGHADAVTALLASPGAGMASWRTWHAYPQTGEIVATRTVASLEVAR